MGQEELDLDRPDPDEPEKSTRDVVAEALGMATYQQLFTEIANRHQCTVVVRVNNRSELLFDIRDPMGGIAALGMLQQATSFISLRMMHNSTGKSNGE